MASPDNFVSFIKIKLMLNCIFIKGHCLTFVVPIILLIYLLSGLVCGYFCLLRALVCGPNQADQILCLECLADVSLKEQRFFFKTKIPLIELGVKEMITC